MSARHWDHLAVMLDKPELSLTIRGGGTPAFTCDALLSTALARFGHYVRDLSARAHKEAMFESKVAGVRDEWAFANFVIREHEVHGNLALDPKHTAELMESLEETKTVLWSCA